jgi:hypothetical protein
MMGQQEGGQERLSYSFNLEDHVPQEHLLRGMTNALTWAGCVNTWRTTTATLGAHPSTPN